MTFELRSLNATLTIQVLAYINLLHRLGISNSQRLMCMLLILTHFSLFGCYSQFFSICRWSIWEIRLWVKDAWLALYKPLWQEEYSLVQSICPVYSSVCMATSWGVCAPQLAVTNFILSFTSSLSFLLIYMYFICHISVLSRHFSDLLSGCLFRITDNWQYGGEKPLVF